MRSELATSFADEPVAVTLALERSRAIKAKVTACAADLRSVSTIVQRTDGASQLVGPRVEHCVAALNEVAEKLTQGINDLEQTKFALARAQKALAETKAAVAVAQEEEKRARLRALHDPTTGLPNRNLFDDRLAHAISMAGRHDWTLAVMFIDLDDFKSINDSHGHFAGDRVLSEVAKRLVRQARAEDTICRYGGDEFVCLWVNPQGSQAISRIAGDVVKNIERPMDIGTVPLIVKASVGIAVYPENGVTKEQLIVNADTAMYQAKRAPGSCVFFNKSE